MKRSVYSDMILYLIDGKPNRENIGPSCIYFNGTVVWYKNGTGDRNKGPAVIYSSNGLHLWYRNGKYIK